jgi:hypothetical protein
MAAVHFLFPYRKRKEVYGVLNCYNENSGMVTAGSTGQKMKHSYFAASSL